MSDVAAIEVPNPRAERKRRRRERWDVLAGLRHYGFSNERASACGHKRVAFEVEVKRGRVEKADGTTVECAHFGGLLRCGSVWECPVCSGKIRAERANEVRQAVDEWGHQQTYMLTLTVRHGRGNDLAAARRGVADAYRRFTRGAPWERLCELAGVEHSIRALEVTYGPNGWHPHLHVLWFVEVPLSATERERLTALLLARWQQCVEKEMGQEARPNARGVDLRPCHSADYVSKFAFELTDPAASKEAASGYRNPWQIAIAASRGDARAGWLWRAYCDGMRGAKMLTWSRGLRDWAGLGEERDDQAIADGDEEGAELVAMLPAHVWDRLRYRRNGPCAVLEAAELAAGPVDAWNAIVALVQQGGDLLDTG